MNYGAYFKSIIEQDNCAVVICSKEHEILYMNPAAVRNYVKYGGSTLIGRSLLACHNEESREKIKRVTAWFEQSPDHNRVHTFYYEKQQKDVYMVALREEDGSFIGYYEKHEYRAADTAPFYEMENCQ